MTLRLNLTFEQRKRLMYIGAGTLVVVLVLWFGLIGWQSGARARNKTLLTEAQTKVSDTNRLLGMAKQKEQELAEKRAELEEIENGMATGAPYLAWMRQTVNKFKEPYKVEIPQFFPVQVGEVQMLPSFPYQEATCKVKGKAFFHDFGKFVADFENAFGYIRIQNLQLKPATGLLDSEDLYKLEFQMDIVALISKSSTSK